MTHFTTVGEPDPARFTHRVGREVVVQHEGIATLAFQGVDDLGIPGGTQRDGTNGLGFAAGEQRRTVYLGQNIHFAGNRTHGAGVAAIDAGLA